MIRGIVCLAGLAVMLCAGIARGQQVMPTPADLTAITERGRELAAYDRAVWHATDAVQMANPKTAQGERSIARPEGGKWRVVFGALDAEKTKFLISYEAVESAKPQQFEAVAHDTPLEDTTFYFFAACALELATADFGRTGRPYSTAVLPASAGQLYVYLYPAQTKAGVYPLGGDVRYLVSADGEKILEKRQLHKTIIETRPGKGKKVLMGVDSHVLSDVPEDTDVLHVLQQDPPMAEMVGTAHFVYEITADGTIRVKQAKK